MNVIETQKSGELYTSTIEPVDRQIPLLIATSSLYIGFGAVLGLIQGGLPAILLSSGWGIGSAGLSYAFYLPFGLAFLWASWIDRWRPPFSSSTSAWIFWMQGISCLVVVALAFVPGQTFAVFVVLGLILAFSMATMDLALDGVNVELIRKSNRNRAASFKFASLACGSVLGGGVLVGQFESLQREGLFLSLAVILALLLVPFAILNPQAANAKKNSQEKASLIKIFRNPETRTRLLLLCLIASSLSTATGINRLMLVAVGMPLTQVGWLVGTFGPISMMVASGLAYYLMSALGHRLTLISFTIVSIGAIFCMLAGIALNITFLAVIGSIVIGGSVGGVLVVYGARMMTWAHGDQPVTDYAAFYGMGRFSSTITIVLGALLAGLTGWVWYLAGVILIYVALLIYFYRGDDQ